MSVDKSLLNSMTLRILSLVIVLVFAVFIINKLFPEDKDVNPVLKDSKHLKQESKDLNKKVITDDQVKDVKPIGDIPTIDIVQPHQQPTNENLGESGASYKIEPIIYSEVERYSQEAKRELESIGQKPAEDWQNDTPPLIVPYILQEGINADNPCNGIDNCE